MRMHQNDRRVEIDDNNSSAHVVDVYDGDPQMYIIAPSHASRHLGEKYGQPLPLNWVFVQCE